MTELLRKLAGLLRRNDIGAGLHEEIETHLEMKASATSDPHAARRQFGNTALLLEDARAAWGWPRIEAWLRDFRYAARMVTRMPAFAATVILTLALGIGASSAIFSLIDTVLIRALPYPDSERLMAVHDTRLADLGSRVPVSPGRLEDLRRLSRTFEAIAGSHVDTLTDTTGVLPERISAAFVSPGFFSVLKAPPALGRAFNVDEERFGGPPSIVIGDALWRRRFAADPGVLGRGLTLTGRSYTNRGRHASSVPLSGYFDGSLDAETG